MTKKIEYVHVLESATRKIVHTVECRGKPAERVAAGMAINMDHDKYELAISESPTEP